MTDIVKNMARVYCKAMHEWENSITPPCANPPQEAMRAALLYLADNINGRMVDALRCSYRDSGYLPVRQKNTPFDALAFDAIAAAIRAAAGEEK